MKNSWIIGGALAVLVTLGGFVSQAPAQQLRPASDPFESRRRDQEYRNQLRRQQELAKQRQAVPTFTIPQPALNNGFNNNPYNNRYYDPRFDRGYRDNYVFIPGHYQVVYGQLVYVPPHWEYVPR